MNTKQEEDFNAQAGQRLSLLRKSQRMSLEYLGACLGVSYQQAHKYETGETTIPPKRIQLCAKLFNVPVGYFYGEDETSTHHPRFNKTILTIAAEVQDLPEDVRKGLYHLSRQINKTLLELKDNTKDEAA